MIISMWRVNRSQCGVAACDMRSIKVSVDDLFWWELEITKCAWAMTSCWWRRVVLYAQIYFVTHHVLLISLQDMFGDMDLRIAKVVWSICNSRGCTRVCIPVVNSSNINGFLFIQEPRVYLSSVCDVMVSIIDIFVSSIRFWMRS